MHHCTLYAFEEFGALYIHNHDDKYLAPLGFEPGRLPPGYKPRLWDAAQVITSSPKQTEYVGPMLIQCWASVVDGGPTLDQHRANELCRLGVKNCFKGSIAAWK